MEGWGVFLKAMEEIESRPRLKDLVLISAGTPLADLSEYSHSSYEIDACLGEVGETAFVVGFVLRTDLLLVDKKDGSIAPRKLFSLATEYLAASTSDERCVVFAKHVNHSGTIVVLSPTDDGVVKTVVYSLPVNTSPQLTLISRGSPFLPRGDLRTALKVCWRKTANSIVYLINDLDAPWNVEGVTSCKIQELDASSLAVKRQFRAPRYLTSPVDSKTYLFGEDVSQFLCVGDTLWIASNRVRKQTVLLWACDLSLERPKWRLYPILISKESKHTKTVLDHYTFGPCYLFAIKSVLYVLAPDGAIYAVPRTRSPYKVGHATDDVVGSVLLA